VDWYLRNVHSQIVTSNQLASASETKPLKVSSDKPSVASRDVTISLRKSSQISLLVGS
jgi:hypothetical protein